METKRHRCMLGLLLAGLAVASTKAQEAKYPPLSEYMMAQDAEIALAKSAAPDFVSDHATVKVFTASGFQTAHEGDNGFVCMVMRGFTGAPTFTPVQVRAQVDALDEAALEDHISEVVNKAGTIDISFNAITPVPQPGTQGIPIAQLSVESFTAPITAYMRSYFLTARAAARRMVENRSGVILIHTPEPARLGVPLIGGMGPAWAAMEAFNRNLSAEFGSYGIRAVCLRSTGLPETHTIEVVFGLHAQAMGIPQEQFLKFVESMTHRKRSSTLAEVANEAVFLASDRASGLTGTVANLTGGMIVD